MFAVQVTVRAHCTYTELDARVLNLPMSTTMNGTTGPLINTTLMTWHQELCFLHCQHSVCYICSLKCL